MATIDRAQLLADTKFWLPPDNTLPDDSITTINELIISQVGDDDIYYAEVLCKSLKAVAQKNLSDLQPSMSGLSKEKVGDVEYGYFKGASTGWQDYIDSLSDICPLFGYSPKRAVGIKINSGESYNPLCQSSGDKFLQ